MGVECFTCGATFKGSTKDLLRHYKQQYEEKGIERYFYKLHKNDSVKIVRKSCFKTIFEEQIKPNFINGAEYSHISEYNPKP